MERTQRTAPEDDWQMSAACQGIGTDLFFPVGERGEGNRTQIRLAKEVCRRCDVRSECLNWALKNNEEHGIWGGLTEDERRPLKKNRPSAQIIDKVTA